MNEKKLKEFIKQTVTDMYSEIAAVAKESANATSNISGYDTKVWGKQKRKYSLLDDEEEQD